MESDLHRFINAQKGVYQAALSELRAGRKTGHWMWFIFPQFQGLGSSPASEYYAIRSLGEARHFLAHQTLGKRLIDCTQAVLSHKNISAEDIFGYPDVWKFRSCMTLFELASDKAGVFSEALDKYYDGNRDKTTIELIKKR